MNTHKDKWINSNLQGLCGPCCWSQTLVLSPWTVQGSHCVWPCLSPGCNGSHLLAPDGTFLVIGYEICYNHCLPVPEMPPSSDGSPEVRCHYSVEPTPSLHLSANRYATLNQDNRIKITSTLKSQDVPDRCCCSQDGPSHGKCKKSVRLVFPDPQSY